MAEQKPTLLQSASAFWRDVKEDPVHLLEACGLGLLWLGVAYCVAYPELAPWGDIDAISGRFVSLRDSEYVIIAFLLYLDLFIAFRVRHTVFSRNMFTVISFCLAVYVVMALFYIQSVPDTTHIPQEIPTNACIMEPLVNPCGRPDYIITSGNGISMFYLAFFLLWIPRVCSYWTPRGAKTFEGLVRSEKPIDSV